jgi:hypothetical protein
MVCRTSMVVEAIHCIGHLCARVPTNCYWMAVRGPAQLSKGPVGLVKPSRTRSSQCRSVERSRKLACGQSSLPDGRTHVSRARKCRHGTLCASFSDTGGICYPHNPSIFGFAKSTGIWPCPRRRIRKTKLRLFEIRGQLENNYDATLAYNTWRRVEELPLSKTTG